MPRLGNNYSPTESPRETSAPVIDLPIEKVYEQYFAPDESIPSNQLYRGLSLQQPEWTVHINVINVYDNDGHPLTF